MLKLLPLKKLLTGEDCTTLAKNTGGSRGLNFGISELFLLESSLTGG